MTACYGLLYSLYYPLQGHYGEVYKGRYNIIGNQWRPVAIKSLKQRMFEEFAGDFEKEIQIMMLLKHDNIIQIIGQCPPEGRRELNNRLG